MTRPLDPRLSALARASGIDPARAQTAHPPGLGGAPMSAATEALGLKRDLTHRSHRVGIELALMQVHTDAVRKVLDKPW